MTIDLCTTGPLGLALARLAFTHPLHAATLDAWDLVEDGVATGTMAVGLGENGRIRLTYDSAFLQRISADEAAAVLQHELNHVLFGHLTATAKEFPDAAAQRLAQEMTANEFVSGPLPDHPILLQDFPGFPPGESTKERYLRLEAAGHPPNIAPGPGGTCCETEDGQGSPQLVEQILAADIAAAASRMDPVDASAALESLARDLSTHGSMAGLRARIITIAGGSQGTVHWREILRRITVGLSEPRLSLRRPSRRLPHLLGIVPGRARVPERPSIMAVLDTSGSMCGPKTLAAIRSAVEGLSLLANVLIVECDDRIHRTYRFTGALLGVAGGGGTSFTEPLRAEFLKSHRVDAVFYFTDGFGRAPSRPPPVRLVWCLVGEGARPPATWGKVLRVSA